MKIKLILPMITIGLALLLVLSYLFPNQVLDTYTMNLQEESEESLLKLEEGSSISYTMNTGNRPIRGIQPAISKQGGSFEAGLLRYEVYQLETNQLVSDNTYKIGEGEELQYVYLPFLNFEECYGDICIVFTYESNGDTHAIPALLVNDFVRENTVTEKNGQSVPGGLKGYYVYTHNTYPLVYDLKILFLLLIAMSMTCSYQKKKSEDRGGKKWIRKSG